MSLHWLAKALIVLGCGCLTAVAIDRGQSEYFQHVAAETLDHALMAPAPRAAAVSEDRLVGRLEIPRLRLSVIVMEGDDEATLALAAGHVRGTALPWDSSNAVIAGHRDTFFRPLRKIRLGDEIRMTTARGTFDYRVTRTEIVEPDDVSALAPASVRSLTLVTCYPFVYVGAAPLRFIVHAR